MSVSRSIRAAKYRTSLLRFGKNAFPVFSGVPYVHGNHVGLMAAYLEALAKKEIKRLLMTLPPSCSKSSWMNVIFPAWVWTWAPEMKIQSFAYNETLAIRDQMLCRELIGSEWYRSHFPHVRVKYGQDQKKVFALEGGGERRIGVPDGGLGTGGHSDIYLFDDVLSRGQAESPTERKRVITWYWETMSTRGIARDQVHCLGMQRLHVDDLPGSVIERIRVTEKSGGQTPWKHVNLPMRFDEKLAMEDQGYGGDWREEAGALLFPELIDEEKVVATEQGLGKHAANCQLQQDPKRRDGSLFKVTRLVLVAEEELPREFDKIVRFWDFAGTDEREGPDACYTAGVLLARKGEHFYVLDVVRVRIGGDEVADLVELTAEKDEAKYGRSAVLVRFEREPGSSGKWVAESLCKRLRRFPIKDVKPQKSKENRADPVAQAVSRFEVSVVLASWTNDFRDELTTFPGSTYKDQVDALSGAYLEIEIPNDGKGSLSVSGYGTEGEEPEYGEQGKCKNCKRPAFAGVFCCECCEAAFDADDDSEVDHQPRCNAKYSDWFAKYGSGAAD